MDQAKYKAFISYSHRDETWAKWLHKSLETYRPPKSLVGQPSPLGSIPKRLAPVFRDREELPSATDLGTVIQEALRASACQIVICSPQAAQSRWVNEEILAFKRLGREDRIFCVIVAGEPNASDNPKISASECFPAALRFKLGDDGQLSSTPAEPIAADVREGKDGKSNALLKLIAGVLGVGFDSLKRREQQRRHRQLALVATGAFAGMVITTGLAGVALIAQQNAERERIRAEAEAETARQTTGFLIDLFRISDPGEARGNTVTAREMLDKGADRIKVELAGQPAIQATLMDTVGTVYMRLGLYEQARPLLQNALATRRQLPAAGEHLPMSLNLVGELLTLQADFQSAERMHREALAAHKTKERSDEVVAKSLSGLAAALAGQARFNEAEEALLRALQIQQQLYGEVHGDIARTTQDLAQISVQRGDLEKAKSLMEQALQMQRQLHGDLPHPAVAEALNNLMYLMHASGEYATAEKLLVESLAMKRHLLGEKHPEIALGLNNLASMMQDRGEHVGAEKTYRQALEMQRALLGEHHPDVAQTLANLATLLYDKGQTSAALRYQQESLAILRQVFAGDHPEVARSQNTLGYWWVRQGEYGKARQAIDESLQMRQRLFGEEHAQVASSLTHLAMLQVATRDYGSALASARAATKVFLAVLPPGQWRTAVAESAAGAALAGLGKYAEAEKMLLQSYATMASDRSAWLIYKRQTLQYLQQLYQRLDRPAEAERYANLLTGAPRQPY